MNPDVVPYLCWRVIGLLLLALGLAVLLLGFYCGYGFLAEVFNAADVGVVNLATFFAILSGLGIVTASAGYSLLLIDRPPSRLELVPWPLLTTSGLLLIAGLLAIAFCVLYWQPPHAADAIKGLGIIGGLALGFVWSGMNKRKMRTRRFFR
ncbi:MAG: hypothetical protein II007_01080 [Gammaproteobacteria bacterium]|nr:hypothetical protein [Gammaproteobacteria bacterium]